MSLTERWKALFIETAKALKGTARRVFMAKTVRALGEGGQRKAARELGYQTAPAAVALGNAVAWFRENGYVC